MWDDEHICRKCGGSHLININLNGAYLFINLEGGYNKSDLDLPITEKKGHSKLYRMHCNRTTTIKNVSKSGQVTYSTQASEIDFGCSHTFWTYYKDASCPKCGEAKWSKIKEEFDLTIKQENPYVHINF